MLGLCAVSLFVDFIVHVLVDVVVVALPLATADVLGDPDHWSGFCDSDDNLDFVNHHVWAWRWFW